jgi:hypothetical protein
MSAEADYRPRGALTTLVVFLVVIAAPVALVVTGTLAVRDARHRTRWLFLAGTAAAAILLLYVPLFFATPMQTLITAN